MNGKSYFYYTYLCVSIFPLQSYPKAFAAAAYEWCFFFKIFFYLWNNKLKDFVELNAYKQLTKHMMIVKTITVAFSR